MYVFTGQPSMIKQRCIGFRYQASLAADPPPFSYGPLHFQCTRFRWAAPGLGVCSDLIIQNQNPQLLFKKWARDPKQVNQISLKIFAKKHWEKSILIPLALLLEDYKPGTANAHLCCTQKASENKTNQERRAERCGERERLDNMLASESAMPTAYVYNMCFSVI